MLLKTKLRALAVAFIAAMMLTLSGTTASADTWHHAYYHNWFKGWLKCVSRGEQVIGNRNDDQRIYGAISYACYKLPGERKYSMDILFEDYPGGGGGGGGGSC